jgi:diguanylate cyclase (GGDEF)-like protein
VEVALVVDDSAAVRQRIASALRDHHVFERVDEATNGAEALARLASEPKVDLVICDLDMPGVDGFKFVAALRDRDHLKDLPVIMLSGVEDPAKIARALDLGASDFVRKPFDAIELLARVRVQLKIEALRMDLEYAKDRLEALATTDGLTGLLNRRTLMERVEQEWIRGARYSRPFAFVMIDLDRFKAVNDEYGHQVGDAVLKIAAERLQAGVRPTDQIGRYGGEEFAAVLGETTLAGALTAAERLRRIIAEAPFEVEGIQPLPVTASFGVAATSDRQVGSVEQLVEAADRALYRAKSEGRNRVSAAE